MDEQGGAAVAAAVEQAMAPPEAARPLSLVVESPVGNKTTAIETTTTDMVMDVRHFLFRLPETCYFTSYHLEVKGQPLNDFLALNEYDAFREAGPQEQVAVKMVPDYYDQRASRGHVRKFREILVSPPYQLDHGEGPYFAAPSAAAAAAAAASGAAGKKKKKKTKGGKKGAAGAAAEPAPDASSAGRAAEALRLASRPLETGPRAALDVARVLEPELVRQQMVRPIECVRNVQYSAWNPPPGPRRLRGDLAYLVVRTLEGHELHVTSCAEGFFVNRSTRDEFSAEPADAPYRSHTLVELLKQASPRFNERFHRLLSRKVPCHPLQDGDAHVPAEPWLVVPDAHTADWNRAEAAMTDTFGMDTLGVMRDWNEEYQGCREMPSAELDERILRDRTACRVFADFVAAATEGARAVIEGNIVPVNPVENERHQVWLFNSIFFSRPADPTERYVEHGDEIAYKLVNLDMGGVRSLAELDVPRLHVLAQCVVDYRGTRMLCQSVIPGIFHDKTSEHLYGSLNQGKHVMTDARLHKLMGAAAARLHMAEHAVLDGQGEERTIYGAVDCKGMRGSEGRFYMVDLARTTPRDSNYEDPVAHLAHCIRPEAVSYFCRARAFRQLMEEQKAAAEAKQEEEEAAKALTAGGDDGEAKDEAAAAAKDEPAAAAAAAAEEEVDLTGQAGDPESSSSDDEAKAEAGKAAAEEAAKAEMREQSAYLKALAAQRFNNDAFTPTRLGGDEEAQEAERAKIRALGSFVTGEAIPKLVRDLETMQVAPVDSVTLTELLHERGINLRYLGRLSAALGDSDATAYARDMVLREVVVRSAKHVFREALASVGPAAGRRKELWYVEPVTLAFLNAFLGEHCGGAGLTDDDLEVASRVLAARTAASRAQRERESKVLAQNETLLMMDIEMHAAEGAAAAEAEAAAAEDADLPLPRVVPPVFTHLSAAAAAQQQAAAKKDAQQRREDVVRHADGKRAADGLTSPANLWQRVRAEARARFSLEVPARVSFDRWARLAMLRSFCQKTGVRLVARDYALGAGAGAEPFVAGDVADVAPVVKASHPRTQDAEDLLEAARTALSRGEVGATFQYAREALYVSQMVVGHVHRLAIDIYATLAVAHHLSGDAASAVEKQQAAVVVAERVLGLDSAETAHQHSLLASYLLVAGMGAPALAHAKRALFLFRSLCGPNHPTTAVCHSNVAAVYRLGGDGAKAIEHVREALRASTAALGARHVQTAHLRHSLASCHAYLSNFRQAIAEEKAAKELYTALLGADNQLVKVSKHYLGQYTGFAVQQAGKPMPAGVVAAARSTKAPPVPLLRWSPLRPELPFRGRTMDSYLQMIETAAQSQTAMLNARRVQEEQRRVHQRYLEALGGINGAAPAAGDDAEAEAGSEAAEAVAEAVAEPAAAAAADAADASAEDATGAAAKKRNKNKRRRKKKKADVTDIEGTD